MMKDRISGPTEALDYMAECALATVDSLASRKSHSKAELRRHVAIAQVGLDWLIKCDYDLSRTCRLREVAKNFNGQIAAYANYLIAQREKQEVETKRLKEPKQ